MVLTHFHLAFSAGLRIGKPAQPQKFKCPKEKIARNHNIEDIVLSEITRRERSKEIYVMEAAATTAGTRRDLLSMLKSLPPSRELLDFYHAKLDSFEKEERQWLERISDARKSQKRTLELERRLSDRDAEIAAIRKAVVDLTVAIELERKRNDKLQKRLDRTKVELL